MGEKQDLTEIAFVGAEPSPPEREKEEQVPEEVVEWMRKKGKLAPRTVRAGTNFYSGPYPDFGEPIGKAEERMTIGVFAGIKRWNKRGQMFFPTDHEVSYEGQKIPAWVGKNPGEKGYIRD